VPSSWRRKESIDPSRRRLKTSRWHSFLFLLPILVLGGIAVWAVRVEEKRAESELLAEIQSAAEQEARLWDPESPLEQRKQAGTALRQVFVPEEAISPDWYPHLQILDAAERERWGGLFERLDAANQLLREGSRDTAATMLRELREHPLVAEARSRSGLPFVALVVRAQLDAEPKERRREVADELVALAFSIPSAISRHLVMDAGYGWEGWSALFDEFGAWSREDPVEVIDDVQWYADFSHPSGRVALQCIDEALAAVRSRQEALRSGAEIGFSLHGQPIGEWGHRQDRLGYAAVGPVEVFVVPAFGESWRIPIEERVAKLTWKLSTIWVIVSLAMLGAWLISRKYARLAELESNFIASVSHELRTPVASIGVLAERLESGKVQSPEQVAEYHRLIAREGRRLAALIDNVLDFSRIEQGRKDYEFEEIDFHRLVSETIALLNPYAEEMNLKFELNLDLPEDGLTPRADAIAIRQMLMNLVDNAIKFTPSGGTIRVSLGTVDGGIALTVEDTGPGIPKEERHRIFDRFYRSDNSLTRETTGAGIGLSIVHHIVHGHGGTIQAQSGETGGARFVVKLPILQVE
jgi:signal transduction histidine kinase